MSVARAILCKWLQSISNNKGTTVGFSQQNMFFCHTSFWNACPGARNKQTVSCQNRKHILFVCCCFHCSQSPVKCELKLIKMFGFDEHIHMKIQSFISLYYFCLSPFKYLYNPPFLNPSVNQNTILSPHLHIYTSNLKKPKPWITSTCLLFIYPSSYAFVSSHCKDIFPKCSTDFLFL